MKTYIRSPLLLSLLMLRRFLPNTEKKNMPETAAFVLSTGRTGTNFLGEYFNKFNDVTALHEPKPSWRLRMWSTAVIEGRATEDDLRQVLQAYRRNTLRTLKTTTYIEANPSLVGFARVIPKVFPGAHIVHIVRDPRDYVRSALNFGSDSGIKKIFNRYVPYWYPEVSRLLRLEGALSSFEMIAAYWTVVNDFLLACSRSLENYQLVTFEELFYDRGQTMQKLVKRIGLEGPRDEELTLEKTNMSDPKRLSSWSDWSPEYCQQLQELCGPLMDRFGYGREEEWTKKLKN